jgi:hypothetical protein
MVPFGEREKGDIIEWECQGIERVGSNTKAVHTCPGVRRKCKQTKQSEVVLAKNLNKTIKTKSAPPAPNHPWRTFPLSALEIR